MSTVRILIVHIYAVGVMTSWYVRALREGRSWQRDDATVDAVQRALL